MPIQRLKNENFFDGWSPQMAYVLGFIFADGSVVTNKRGGKYLEFVSTDLELIEKIKKIIGSSHKIGVYRSKYKHHKVRYNLQIGSKKWVARLNEFGVVQRKSLIVQWPKVPKAHLGNFIRGYFDGDGCVHLGHYFAKDRGKFRWVFSSRFTSGSKLFLTDLWMTLKPHVSGGQLLKKNSGGYDLVFSTHDSLALSRLMYHNTTSDVYLERKYKIFQKAFTILHLRA